MIISKLDVNNYRLIPSQTTTQFNVKQDGLEYKSRSNLLMLKWVINEPFKDRKLVLSGSYRIDVKTPLGDLQPVNGTLTQSIKPYIQWLDIVTFEALEYTIKLSNNQAVNRSTLEVWEFLDSGNQLANSSQLINFSQPQSINISMSGSNNPQAPIVIPTTDLSSVTATLAALGSSLTSTFAAGFAALAMDPLINISTTTPLIPFAFDSVLSTICIDDQSRRSILITNPITNTASFKFFSLPVTSGTKYGDITEIIDEEVVPGGTFEYSDPLSRGLLYAASSEDGAKVILQVAIEQANSSAGRVKTLASRALPGNGVRLELANRNSLQLLIDGTCSITQYMLGTFTEGNLIEAYCTLTKWFGKQSNGSMWSREDAGNPWVNISLTEYNALLANAVMQQELPPV